eukprot:CAMPEP_0201545238 /NCGR_PEP_ID=MMETSP0173_2-20130828/1769_1 /ASSEMBLY_ACC=CAM_ASM_000268 /TAXON_ID=218659 /ORGANISM="Vexillifera sp., Strain DIVA3 564/2" /LENGTH=205 /DNA_ID=CAMNT_0047953579 /DNA_START=40 /DNA_END=657 /DNA_ORIENTATION=-
MNSSPQGGQPNFPPSFLMYLTGMYTTNKSIQAVLCEDQLDSVFDLLNRSAEAQQGSGAAPSDEEAQQVFTSFQNCMQNADLEYDKKVGSCSSKQAQVIKMCGCDLDAARDIVMQETMAAFARNSPPDFSKAERILKSAVTQSDQQGLQRCADAIQDYWDCVADPEAYPRDSEAVQKMYVLEHYQQQMMMQQQQQQQGFQGGGRRF